MAPMTIAPGAVYFPRRLELDAQRAVAARCFELGAGDAGFYVPVVRGGKPMSVRMFCLGRHWNALTYRYEATRADYDAKPAPPLPVEFAELAREIAAEAGFAFTPDLAIVNWYGAGSRMGLHQDKDESRASLETGAPVVSISTGDTGQFRFGGLTRRAAVQTIPLVSGDAFVFGGPSRLCFHGVARIVPGTGPASLGVEGRLNLTFRQY